MNRSFAEALEIARAHRSRALKAWGPWLEERQVGVNGVGDFLDLAEASGLNPDDADEVVGLVLGQLSKLRYRAEVAEMLRAVRAKAAETGAGQRPESRN